MKKASLLFLAIILFAVSVSCGHSVTNSDNDTYEYIDDYGQKITIPSHPKRVVSLSPAVTEIIFTLGADSILVGRTEFCSYPKEAAKIENIGGISNLNIEKVLSVKPDLIISGSMVSQKVVQQFEKMGVPLVCVVEKPVFDGLYENISKIGKLIGCSDKADSVNVLLRERVNMLMNQTPAESDNGTAEQHTPTVYYVVGFGSGGNFTAGGDTFINDIISMSGGKNIAAESKGWAFSVEALMQSNPDYILIRAEDSARFCQTAPYNNLSAVRHGKVIALQSGMIDLQVPRNIDVIQILRERIKQ